jgi:hypothetical protein
MIEMENNNISSNNPTFYTPPTLEEKDQDTYHFEENDRAVIWELFEEIKDRCPYYTCKGRTFTTDWWNSSRYLVFGFSIPGAGEIVAKYINKIKSEYAKARLLYLLVEDKVENCEKIVMNCFYGFRASNQYFADLSSWVMHIFSIQISGWYCWAIDHILNKKLASELIELAKNPTDIVVLAPTYRTIARKYHPAELESIMTKHLIDSNKLAEKYDNVMYAHTIETPILGAMNCLVHFPSQKNIELISTYFNCPSSNVAKHAQKCIDKINKKLSK